jgi:hypothetical protein
VGIVVDPISPVIVELCDVIKLFNVGCAELVSGVSTFCMLPKKLDALLASTTLPAPMSLNLLVRLSIPAKPAVSLRLAVLV